MRNIAFAVSDSLDGLDAPDSILHFRRGDPWLRPEVFSCERAKRGRYVRVIMDKNTTSGSLCFNEVEVYGELPYTGPPTTLTPTIPQRSCSVSHNTSSLGTNVATGMFTDAT